MKKIILILTIIIYFINAVISQKWILANSQQKANGDFYSVAADNLNFLEMDFGSPISFKKRNLGATIKKIPSMGTLDVINSYYEKSTNEISLYVFSAALNYFYSPPPTNDVIYVVAQDPVTKLDEVIGQFDSDGWVGSVIESELIKVPNQDNQFIFICKTNATSVNEDRVIAAYIDTKKRKITKLENIISNKRTGEGMAYTSPNCNNEIYLYNSVVANNTDIDIYKTLINKSGIVESKKIYTISKASNSNIGIIAGMEVSNDASHLILSSFQTNNNKQLVLLDVDENGNLSNERYLYSGNGYLVPVMEFTPDNKNIVAMSGGASGVPKNLYYCPITNKSLDLNNDCKKINLNITNSIDLEFGPNENLYLYEDQTNTFITEISNLASTPSIKKINWDSSFDFRGGFAIPDYLPYIQHEIGKHKIISDSIFCSSTTTTFSINLDNGESVKWYANDLLIGQGKSVSHEINDQTQIVAEVTTGFGCITFDTLDIAFSNLDGITFDDQPLQVCKSSDVNLKVETNSKHETFWSYNGKNISNVDLLQLKVDSSVVVKVKVQLGSTCIKEFTKSITVLEEDNLIIDGLNYLYCAGEQIELNIANKEKFKSYEWLINDKIISNLASINFIASPNEKLTLNAISLNNCNKNYSLPLDVMPISNGDFAIEYDTCSASLKIIPKDGIFGKIILDNGINTQIKTNNIFDITAGLYKLTHIINDSTICKDSFSINLKIDPQNESDAIMLPNIFRPNANSTNNTFCASNEALRTNKFISLSIYDRWGNKMFQSQGQTRCWDGKFNGRDCEEDVYVFVLEFYASNCNKSIKKLVKDILLVK